MGMIIVLNCVFFDILFLLIVFLFGIIIVLLLWFFLFCFFFGWWLRRKLFLFIFLIDMIEFFSVEDFFVDCLLLRWIKFCMIFLFIILWFFCLRNKVFECGKLGCVFFGWGLVNSCMILWLLRDWCLLMRWR